MTVGSPTYIYIYIYICNLCVFLCCCVSVQEGLNPFILTYTQIQEVVSGTCLV